MFSGLFFYSIRLVCLFGLMLLIWLVMLNVCVGIWVRLVRLLV